MFKRFKRWRERWYHEKMARKYERLMLDDSDLLSFDSEVEAKYMRLIRYHRQIAIDLNQKAR